MKTVNFNEEEKRLNISKEDLVKVFERLLSEGKVQGIIDEKNEEFIYFSSGEIENLIELLSSKTCFN